MTPLYIVTIMLPTPKESTLLFTNSSSANLGACPFLILHSRSAAKAWPPHFPPVWASLSTLSFLSPRLLLNSPFPSLEPLNAFLRAGYSSQLLHKASSHSWLIHFMNPQQLLFVHSTQDKFKVSHAKFWLAIFSLKYLVEKIQPQITNHVNVTSKYFRLKQKRIFLSLKCLPPFPNAHCAAPSPHNLYYSSNKSSMWCSDG